MNFGLHILHEEYGSLSCVETNLIFNGEHGQDSNLHPQKKSGAFPLGYMLYLKILIGPFTTFKKASLLSQAKIREQGMAHLLPPLLRSAP